MSERFDSLDRMIQDLRTILAILAILVLAGWSDDQISTCVDRQLQLAHEDPETCAPVVNHP